MFHVKQFSTGVEFLWKTNFLCGFFADFSVSLKTKTGVKPRLPDVCFL